MQEAELRSTPTKASNHEVRVSPVDINPVVTKTVRALCMIAPRFVARQATKIWCSPPVPKKKVKIPGGKFAMVQGLATQEWGTGPLILLMHGWGGYRGHFAELVPALVEAGYRVVAHDAPSQGESHAGELGKGRTSVYEMAGSLNTLAAHFGQPHAVIGHSLGGAAVSLAVGDGFAVPNVVLIAPAADAFVYTPLFAQTFGLSERSYQFMLDQIEAKAGRPNSDADIPAMLVSRSAASLPQPVDFPPALIISDLNDKEVSHTDGEEIAKHWPNSQYVMTQGLGHRRILKDQGVIGQIIDFISR